MISVGLTAPGKDVAGPRFVSVLVGNRKNEILSRGRVGRPWVTGAWDRIYKESVN